MQIFLGGRRECFQAVSDANVFRWSAMQMFSGGHRCECFYVVGAKNVFTRLTM